MEIDMGLYSNDNKQNSLRRKVSGNTLHTNRPCLADITHKYVPKEPQNNATKNIGLFKLANGAKKGSGSVKSALPR